MKACRECGVSKPLSEYYTHKEMGDGHLNKCKECVKARVNAYRAANLERIQEYDRSRGQWPSRKAANKARAERYLAKRAEYLRRHREAYPDKDRARQIVNRALREGKIKVKPCVRCGFAFGIQAHHEDYSKPLDVTWLCTPCHGERHREINAERRAARKAA